MIPRRNNAVPSQQQRHQGRFFRQKYIISVTKLKKVPFFDTIVCFFWMLLLIYNDGQYDIF